MQSDQQRAMWAVILSGIVLFLWQYFFVPKITPPVTSPTVQTTQAPQENSPQANVEQTNKPASPVNEIAVVQPQIFTIKSNNFEAQVSTNLEIMNLPAINASEKMNTVLGEKGKFFLNFYSPEKKPLNNILVSSTSNSEISLTSPDGINAKLNFDALGRLRLTGNIPKGFGYGLSGTAEVHDSSINKRNFAFHLGKLKTVLVGKTGEESGPLKWSGVDYAHYFVGLVSPESPASDLLFGSQNDFQIKSFSGSENLNAYFIFVKKEYEFLKTLGDSLHLTVDFGFFAFLAVPILWLLKFFFNLMQNYGLAIIFLTVLIRLLTFPLQLSSLKGMKKMQALQPELGKLKEKYKDDPMTMQKETMALFKKSGVNPLSGCFPLLLQMPIFFALYSVLYNAVELVGANFFGWIHDLSAKDPYYILPVLMAVSMFVQQKITPTTITDKLQQRVFLFMPLIFGFFMKDLPSGLSLYILVSTLSGILQQVLIFRRLK